MTNGSFPVRFSGAIALVTGGSKPLGRAIALALAEEGADVAVTWHRDDAGAAETVNAVEALGRKAVAVRLVLGDEASLRSTVRQTAYELGDPTVVVWNAAVGAWGPLTTSRRGRLARMVSANTEALLDTLRLSRKVESVAALTSLGARRVQPGYGHVGISKATLEALVRQLAVELAPRTRVNAVSIGGMESGGLHSLNADAAQLLDEARKRTPLERLVTSEDVARAVAFLLSSDAAMVTGHTLELDGGYSLLW